MTQFLDQSPFGRRQESIFFHEMTELCHFHSSFCENYRLIVGELSPKKLEDIPFIHVGAFKSIPLITIAEGIEHQRKLLSSATTSGESSIIALDKKSSELQTKSVYSILGDFIGIKKRPLVVLDNQKSLISRGNLSARIAAALSLQKFASSTHFVLGRGDGGEILDLKKIEIATSGVDDIIVYGFTWVLWAEWAKCDQVSELKEILRGKKITFVHSGGWKKLENESVSRKQFDETLLSDLHIDSRVVDYYGLVEQVGIIYPLCEFGYRHVPIWADIFVRDPWTLKPIYGETGQIQLMNLLARGSPYHSVLTEDLGVIHEGECSCGRSGKRFELIGRMPKAEIRGCANV